MKKIKIAQIGIGHNHAEAKMKTVLKFPDIFEVIGYCESDEKWLEKRGGLDTYKGLRRMSKAEILSSDADAILVETDVWNLAAVAKKCVLSGKHIHMDKPSGENLAEYEQLLALAKERKLCVQLGYMYRYNPAIQKAFEMIKNGELGEIFAINAEMSTEHDPEYRRWLRNFKGGTMFIFGCHLIDLIVLILGVPLRVVPFLKSTEFDQVSAVDNTFCVLDYKGAIAKVTNASVEVNGYGRRQLVICGRRGTIEIKPLEKPTVMTFSPHIDGANAYVDRKQVVPIRDLGGDERYDEQLLDFAKIIRKEKENPYSYEHELLVQKVLLTACGFENINF